MYLSLHVCWCGVSAACWYVRTYMHVHGYSWFGAAVFSGMVLRRCHRPPSTNQRSFSFPRPFHLWYVAARERARAASARDGWSREAAHRYIQYGMSSPLQRLRKRPLSSGPSSPTSARPSTPVYCGARSCVAGGDVHPDEAPRRGKTERYLVDEVEHPLGDLVGRAQLGVRVTSDVRRGKLGVDHLESASERAACIPFVALCELWRAAILMRHVMTKLSRKTFRPAGRR